MIRRRNEFLFTTRLRDHVRRCVPLPTREGRSRRAWARDEYFRIALEAMDRKAKDELARVQRRERHLGETAGPYAAPVRRGKGWEALK